MKQAFLLLGMAVIVLMTACEKSSAKPGSQTEIPESSPRTTVPAALQGNWMYGNFSMTEYWSQNPSTYIGNGFEFAVAFKFEANGIYTHYFTSKVVTLGVATYHQSVTRGTVEVDAQTGKITMHPVSARYKRSSLGVVEEDRNLRKDEMTTGLYKFTSGKEPNGTNALYFLLQGTTTPLTFLQK